MKPKVIYRGKLVYVLYQDKVVVGSSTGLGQWTSYNKYNNWNRKGISEYRQAIEKSGEDEYGSMSDQISLATRCGIVAVSSAKPKELQ